MSFHSLNQPLRDDLLNVSPRITVERQILTGRTEPSIISLAVRCQGIARFRCAPPVTVLVGHDIGLTELTKHAILSYPLPDQQSGEKFAAFTYLHSDAQNPICGTAHNVASPEMLYISGSTGAQFDERAWQLRESEDIVSAIEAATSDEQIAK